MSTPRAIRAASRSQMLPPEPPEPDDDEWLTVGVFDIEPDLVTDDDYPEPESDDEQPA